ncbi:PspA/IM30 family protein [bacterium]|nr:PspA/IM30 family protein [bacterium]
MDIFTRIYTVIQAYINKFLDRVEDPEKLLDQALSDMEEGFRQSKVELARAIADEKRLRKQLDQNIDQVKEWGAKAILAVQKGDDDLAREALKRKNSYETLQQELESHWHAQKDVTDKLKDGLKTLQLKIDEAKRKRNLLLSRQQRAMLQKKVYEALHSGSANSPSQTLNKLEEKISLLEAESSALENLEHDSLDDRFKSLEASDDLENELSALKKKYLADASDEPDQI